MNRWRLTAHCPRCQRTIWWGLHAPDGVAYDDNRMARWCALRVVGSRCDRCGDVDAVTRGTLVAGEFLRRAPMVGSAQNDNGRRIRA